MKTRTKNTAPPKAGATIPRFVGMNDVAAATGISRRHIYYAMVLAGEFPKPVQLGRRRIAFREEDFLAWVESRNAPEWAAA